MDDDLFLEEEFEQELLVEPDDVHAASTPRQRLQDARAMAGGNHGVASGGAKESRLQQSEGVDEEGPEISTHLLQMLTCEMADNGEWQCFHDMKDESQRALAEMNETLGSLRQWQKHRKIYSPPPALTHLEDVPSTAAGERLLYRTDPSKIAVCSPKHLTPLTMNQRNWGDDEATYGGDVSQSAKAGVAAESEQQDPLLALWEKHYLRAQESVGRLKERLNHHPPAVLKPDHPGTSKAGASYDAELLVRNLVTREREEMSVELSSSNNGEQGSPERVAELGRDVDGLQLRQWIQSTRTQASGRAETLAREACEGVWQGAGSAAVGELEGELDGFTKELDSLLLRIDRIDSADRGEEIEYQHAVDLERGGSSHDYGHNPGGGLAPVADSQISCHAAES